MLFENLEAQDDSAMIANRKASAVAVKRVRDHFGAFLANSDQDFSARLALVEDDITAIVDAVVSEYGGDSEKITAAIKKSLVPMPGMVPGQSQGMMPGQGQGQGQGTCPQCGGAMMNGQCPTCGGGGGAYGGQAGAAGAPYGQNHSIPQGPSTGPVLASLGGDKGCPKCGAKAFGGIQCGRCGYSITDDDKEEGQGDPDERESHTKLARRPKMCPYHSEVTDIALGSGDAQAGYNAMASHAWGEKHCKGAYEGTCNFRPAMVTQKYWDDKQNEYQERREQRELERQQAPIAQPEPELSIDTEPIMTPEPLSDEPGKEGVTDIDGELANAPSAVGSGELAMAASTRKEAEALKTVKLPTGDKSGLGGPSPKIDKGNSGDQAGWSLEPIDTQMAGSPHPTKKQDPTDKADYNKEDFLDQTRAVTETVELDSAPNLMDDAGFAPGGEEHGPHTDTWSGQDGQADPVSRESLSATDPDKNPLQTILDEHNGFLMPLEVESALKDWAVG